MFKKLSSCLLLFVCLVTFSMTSHAAEKTLPISAADPSITGESAYLIEANTHTMLYQKNADLPLYPASITKIMTALVAIENTQNFSDVLTFSDAAVNGIDWDSSRIGALVGEQMTVEQALYGLMLKSGNDCAVALAEYVSGSEAAFAELMNQRAAEIGCTNTHFVNSHGLHNENHYTTAHDIALIMAEAVKNDIFHTIDSTVSYSVPSTNLHADGFYWTMSNKMMNPRSSEYYEGVVCGKTGYTDQAGNTLVTCANRGDTYLVCVVMKCPQTHYADTRILFDYGFANYEVYAMSHLDSSLSYDISSSGFFGSLEDIVGGNRFQVSAAPTYLILPENVPLSELRTELVYDENEEGFAHLEYLYQDYVVGETSLTIKPDDSKGFDFDTHENPVPETETQISTEETTKVVFSPVRFLGYAALVIVIGLLLFALWRYFRSARYQKRRRLKRRRLARKRRRENRLRSLDD